MLKSDQQEKVPTMTPAKIHLSNKLWRIPNNVNKEQETHLRNQNQMDLNKPWSISDTTKLRRKTQPQDHYRAPPQKPKSAKTQQNHMSIWPTSETSDADSETNGWQRLTHIWGPDKTWTKHRCSSLDPITHPIRNRRLRQILTARILRRQKSRRRNGKP